MHKDRGPYRRRLRYAGLALAGLLALTGCDEHMPPPDLFGTPATASKIPEQLKQAQDQFNSDVLGVANGIMSDAAKLNDKSKAPMRQADNFTINNSEAIHAHNEVLVDDTIPLISISYDQGQGQIQIDSTDLYFPDNQTNSQPFRQITIIYSTNNIPASSPSDLDKAVNAGQPITLDAFRNFINSGKVSLYNVVWQEGIPYTRSIMQLQPQDTYQNTQLGADAPTVIADDSLNMNILSGYSTQLQGVQARLSAGIK